jgi:hypothetical protein
MAVEADPIEYEGGPEYRYLILSLGADGMDPSGKGGSSRQYSIWPFLLVALNAPAWVRATKNHAMLWMLTQGPHEPTSMAPYLSHITTVLNKLLRDGVRTWDGHKGEWFQLRVALCYIGADSRGKEKLLQYVGTGARMSHPMYDEACGEYVGNGINGRMVYGGWIRRLLPEDHTFRVGTVRKRLAIFPYTLCLGCVICV